MQATTYLAGDLGGTKTLLAIYSDQNGKLKREYVQRYVSAEWTSLDSMLKHFLQSRPDANSTPHTSCFAVAGPVKVRAVELTNLGWSINQESLKKSADLEEVELVNDFAVLIYGLPHFSDSQQLTLQKGSRLASDGTRYQQGPVAILGAGTGLGMARGLPSSARISS